MEMYKKLKRYLVDHHFNQSAIARAIGKPPQTLASVLSGHSRLSADDLVLICNEIGVETKVIENYDITE